MYYFTSDLHFYHKNIIDYSGRPFRTADGHLDVNMMNDELIRRYNERVGADDHVFFLGDISFGPKKTLAPTVRRLNGHKVLIRGNHDRSADIMLAAGFEWVADEVEWIVDDVKLYLRHEPKLDYSGPGLHICGHVHEKWKRIGNVINVGVDVWDYRPITLGEIIAAPQDVRPL